MSDNEKRTEKFVCLGDQWFKVGVPEELQHMDMDAEFFVSNFHGQRPLLKTFTSNHCNGDRSVAHSLTAVANDDPDLVKDLLCRKLGLDLYEKLGLEPVVDRVLGVMRKCDRPRGGCINIWDGTNEGEEEGRGSILFCVALSPETQPRTALDLLQAMLQEQPSEALREEVQECVDRGKD